MAPPSYCRTVVVQHECLLTSALYENDTLINNGDARDLIPVTLSAENLRFSPPPPFLQVSHFTLTFESNTMMLPRGRGRIFLGVFHARRSRYGGTSFRVEERRRRRRARVRISRVFSRGQTSATRQVSSVHAAGLRYSASDCASTPNTRAVRMHLHWCCDSLPARLWQTADSASLSSARNQRVNMPK